MSEPRRIIVGMTGATGTIIAVRVLQMLRDAGVETHLVMSKWAVRTLLHETPYRPEDVERLAARVYAAGKDPGRVMAAQSAKLLPDVLAFYRSSGVSEGFLSGVRRAFTLNELALTRYFPGLVLVSALLYGVLLVYPFGALAGLRSRDLSESPFSRFSTPIWAAALFVPAGAAAALAGEPWRAPAVDILLPLIVLFFLRGLAIIRALLDQARAGCVGQALIFALVLLTPFPVIVALGGLFDEFLNFRGRLARRDTDHD